jgi:hypothetical protein
MSPSTTPFCCRLTISSWMFSMCFIANTYFISGSYFTIK